MMKTCRACKEPKPPTAFHKESSVQDGRRATCKDCSNAKKKTWYYQNHEATKVRCNTRNLRRRSAKQGIPERLLERVQVLRQKTCWLCGSPPKGNRALHLDHDHQTGEFRGLLCYNCNLALGYFRDNSRLLRRAADYLEAPPGVDKLESAR